MTTKSFQIDPDSDGHFYLSFHLRGSLHFEEEEDFIDVLRGEIRFEAEDGKSQQQVGDILGYRVRAGRALNESESLTDICDFDMTIADYAGAVFDPENGYFREEICDGTAGMDLLILHEVKLLPEYRGSDLGLLAAARFVAMFREECGAVVCKPYPLQFSENPEAETTDRLEKGAFAGISKKIAKQKLRRQWAKLGFKQVGNSDLFAIDLAFHHPGFKEIAKQWEDRR